MFPALQNSSADWGYHIERSHKVSRSIANDVVWPRGKFLGGSGGMQVMLYVRGNPRDYNHWQQLGNPTWGWSNVSEYFKRSESFEESSLGENDTIHGHDGPLKINWVQNDDAFKQVLFDAAKELGYKQLEDINGIEQMGIGIAPAVVDQGIPSSPAKAFLSPAKDRANLHVIKHAFVTKVNIDNSTGEATGVEFIVRNATATTAKVRKEIILSAGSVGTPQILQLSGIGAEKYLRRLNIPLIRHLKVGFSLQDHIYAPVFLQFNASKSVTAAPTDSTDDLYNYIRHKEGVFSTKRIFDVIGFFNTVNATDAHPNIAIQFAVFKRGEIAILTDFLNKVGYNDTVARPIFDANNAADIAVVFIILLNPLAMGKIRLNSTNPFIAPRIQPNHLDRREDVTTLVQGIQLLRTFYGTSSFLLNEVSEINMNVAECIQSRPKKVKVKPAKSERPAKSTKSYKGKGTKGEQRVIEQQQTEPIVELPPGPEPIAYGSDQYWECYIRHFATSMSHAVGTAKMGPATDPFAVVDSRLGVHGLKGLRVIDASVMPKITSGNINTATVMIAEKGSDFVKEDWANRTSGEQTNKNREEL